MGAIAFIFAPLVAALAFTSVRPALAAGVGILVTVASGDAAGFAHRQDFHIAHRSFCRRSCGFYVGMLESLT